MPRGAKQFFGVTGGQGPMPSSSSSSSLLSASGLGLKTEWNGQLILQPHGEVGLELMGAQCNLLTYLASQKPVALQGVRNE